MFTRFPGHEHRFAKHDRPIIGSESHSGNLILAGAELISLNSAMRDNRRSSPYSWNNFDNSHGLIALISRPVNRIESDRIESFNFFLNRIESIQIDLKLKIDFKLSNRI